MSTIVQSNIVFSDVCWRRCHGEIWMKKKTFLLFSAHSAPTCWQHFCAEPNVDSRVTGDCRQIKNQTLTYENMETVRDYWRERLFFKQFQRRDFSFLSLFWRQLRNAHPDSKKRERQRWRNWLSVFLWNEETVYYWFTKVKFVGAEWMHLFKTRGKNTDGGLIGSSR